MKLVARQLRRRLALTSAIAIPASALSLLAVPAAQAATNDQAVSGIASAMWQTNQPVDALAVGGGVIYAGGNFTQVRPSGAASGTNQTARTYLAAFNASTGSLITTFNVRLNGRVYALDLSPDGRTLYVGGAFTTVNSTARNRIAAITLATGALNTSFNPNANAAVRSIESTASTVYIGGDFKTVGGRTRANLASVTASTGALNTGFAPTFIQRPTQTCPTNPPPGCTTQTYAPNVLALAMAPDGSRLLTGGDFMGVNGVSSGGMASLDPTTGATEPWNANTGQPINTNCAGRVTDIVVQGSNAYVTGEGDPPGCYEGTYSANISNGTINWLSSCLGASEGLTIMNNILYKGSHQHDCAFNQGGAAGGFVGGTGRSGFIHKHLVGQNIADGTFVHWTPNTNGSGSAPTGPHVMANDGNQIIVGGDFTSVNGTNQQGLARFVANGNHATPAVPGRNINADPFGGQPATLASNLQITAQPTKANTLTVEVPAVEDIDSGTLTYRIYRDNGSTPVATLTAESYPWNRPVLRFDDTGLAAGSTHTYRVSASDGTFTSAQSTAVSGTVASSAPAAFATAMSNLNPLLWWRLADSGTTAADSSSSGSHPGDVLGGVTTGAPGALTGNGAMTLNGSTGYLTSDNQIAAPNAFSESVWFKTTTTLGGSILAQTDTKTGAGGNTDRTITMDDNGGLVFAVKQPGAGSPFGPATTNFRNQGPIWNDGKWHQVVGTYNGTGTISLYVDGKLQGSTAGTDFSGNPVNAAGMPTSYLRAGYADLSGMQMVFGINFYNRSWPLSAHFAGSLDEAAAFNYALSPAQVQSMFASGVGGGA
ncbi:MAG: LamG domain-containing protein [Nocardioides sp.]